MWTVVCFHKTACSSLYDWWNNKSSIAIFVIRSREAWLPSHGNERCPARCPCLLNCAAAASNNWRGQRALTDRRVSAVTSQHSLQGFWNAILYISLQHLTRFLTDIAISSSHCPNYGGLPPRGRLLISVLEWPDVEFIANSHRPTQHNSTVKLRRVGVGCCDCETWLSFWMCSDSRRLSAIRFVRRWTWRNSAVWVDIYMYTV